MCLKMMEKTDDGTVDRGNVFCSVMVFRIILGEGVFSSLVPRSLTDIEFLWENVVWLLRQVDHYLGLP